MVGKFKGFLRVLRKPIFIIGALIVVIAVVVASLTLRKDNSTYEFVTAERQDLKQEVSVTGQVKAAKVVELAFDKTGIISSVPVDIGDTVTAGQTLVSIKSSDTLALLNQAEAQAAAEQANLSKLIDNEDAEQELANSYNDVINTVNEAISTSEDAVRFKSAGVFHGSEIKGYDLSFSACDYNISKSASELRLEAEVGLDKWDGEVSGLTVDSSRETLDAALKSAQDYLNLASRFVDITNRALLTDCALKDSSLDDERTNMATAQTNVLSAVSTVNSLMQTIASQKVAVANTSDVAAQQARVRAAESNIYNYQAQLSQTVISSPIDGIVTKQEAKVGQTVSPNTTVVTVMSASGFEIDTYIPEADIAKVKIGDSSSVTLDAYGNDVLFEARVTEIEPAETVIDGVTTYKTTLQFSEEDERIKSGMTANLDILTAERKSVIAVPQRSVVSDNGDKIVRILEEKGVVEVGVETGLRGSDGKIEIIKGVNEGDKVVTFVNEG